MSAEADVEVLEDTEEFPENEPKPEHHAKLPLGRIRNIMKLDPDLHMVNKEAVYLIAKATELFIAAIGRESYAYTQQAKKKTIQKKDVVSAVDNIDAFAFLEGTLEQ